MSYEVGYGRPPKWCRFKKGQSGNSKGRPKRLAAEADLGTIFRKVANEMIIVADQNGAREISRWQALFRQLIVLAMGDKRTSPV